MDWQIEYHRVFVKNFKKLPGHIKDKAIYLEEIFKTDPFSPILKTKPLKGEFSHLYSFRITREYRIIFEITAHNLVVFYNVGHRKDIYR